MKLAVIGTFHGRLERSQELVQRVMTATRPPDEFWVMCEDEDDAAAARCDDQRVMVRILPTPKAGDSYAVIPYSNKINWALDRTDADLICYLDNGSTPLPSKYGVMVEALEQNPEWGAVYCGQRRTGHVNSDVHTNGIIGDAYCVLNYTQVMHRRTEDRWTLDMAHAVPLDLADALFWRSLHATLGPFHPVAEGELLDEHHIESAKAVGL